ncbi:MAG: hypothetical protein ICV71_03470 [Thermoleophilia bacterium]|nr:hypothetical protein [Thermoleophilia bacterium]MDQ3857659.1 hypothetical protein [Actinomycetota bacterium]
MCWERMSEGLTDDVKARETRENPVASDDELELVEAWGEPTKEAVEAEEELARV